MAHRPLALTLGEPAGIGPDTALLAWHRRATHTVPAFLALGDPDLLRDRASRLGLDVPLAPSTVADAAQIFAHALPILPCGPKATAMPGVPDRSSAEAVLTPLALAVDMALDGRAAALVTGPLNKKVVYGAGFPFPGHTEYLAARRSRPGEPAPRPVMLIWSERLAVVPATIHVPLADVPRLLTSELLLETARIVDRDYRARFAVPRPRLAFCGLNPHAGEEGTIGSEDEEVVRPTVDALIAEGIDARGPFSADTLFHEDARATYDVAIGMYHDQVLIPAKTLAFHDGVNATLGLPFVRTSPDHGTAFAIAGTGRADPSSLIAALKLARRLADAEREEPVAAEPPQP